MSEQAYGVRLRQRRQELGMSAVELSRKVGVAQPVIHQIEDGRVKFPRMALQQKIAEALQTTLLWMWGIDGEQEHLEKVSDFISSVLEDPQAFMKATAEIKRIRAKK